MPAFAYFRAFIGAVTLKHGIPGEGDVGGLDFRAFIGAVTLKLYADGDVVATAEHFRAFIGAVTLKPFWGRFRSKRKSTKHLEFWLGEVRSPELLVELAARFPTELARLQSTRPLLALAKSGDLPELRAELDAEARTEQDKDCLYWAPLKRELESFRWAERRRETD